MIRKIENTSIRTLRHSKNIIPCQCEIGMFELSMYLAITLIAEMLHDYSVTRRIRLFISASVEIATC